MSVNFQPDICLPNDPAGFGRYLTGHYYEHVVLAQKCLALPTPVIVPDYDIFSWSNEPERVQQWLADHQSMHSQIRVAANFTGIDLSLVDFSDEEAFFLWMDDHAQEHLAFRNFFAIV